MKFSLIFPRQGTLTFQLIAKQLGISVEEYFEKAAEEMYIEMKLLEATPAKFDEYIERIAKKSLSKE